MKLYMRRCLRLTCYDYLFYDDKENQTMAGSLNLALGLVPKEFLLPPYCLRQKNPIKKMMEAKSGSFCPFTLYENSAALCAISREKRAPEKEATQAMPVKKGFAAYAFTLEGAPYRLFQHSQSAAYLFKNDFEEALFSREDAHKTAVTYQTLPPALAGILAMFCDEMFFNDSDKEFGLHLQTVKKLKEAGQNT